MKPDTGNDGQIRAVHRLIDPKDLPTFENPKPRPEPVQLHGIEPDETHCYSFLQSEWDADADRLFHSRVRRCSRCASGFLAGDAILTEVWEENNLIEFACPFCGSVEFLWAYLYGDEIYERRASGAIVQRKTLPRD